jgi:hypothetical protein
MIHPKTRAGGAAFAAEAKSAGFRASGRNGIVSVSLTFPAGDRDAYFAAENAARSLLYSVPTTRAGSTWGSTSDGVGGHAALQSGRFVLNVSGVSKNFAAGI